MNKTLEGMAEKLKEIGIVDVRFVFPESTKNKSREEVESSIIEVLSAYFNGDSKIVENFNDEIIPSNPEDLEERIRKGKMKQIMKAAKKEFPDWLGEV